MKRVCTNQGCATRGFEIDTDLSDCIACGEHLTTREDQVGRNIAGLFGLDDLIGKPS